MSEDENYRLSWRWTRHCCFEWKVSDPIHKATIIPRGRARDGNEITERDQLSVTREKNASDIVVAMGGRIAEEIIFVMTKWRQVLIGYRYGY